MFNSENKNANDFADVGILLTNPKNNKKDITCDFFAKKFLKKCIFVVYKQNYVIYNTNTK